jgi:hypothetical protein
MHNFFSTFFSVPVSTEDSRTRIESDLIRPNPTLGNFYMMEHTGETPVPLRPLDTPCGAVHSGGADGQADVLPSTEATA